MVSLGISLVRIGEFAWARCEPEPGQYDWEWLDRSIDILQEYKLDVILGTPTATPPNWLIQKHPEVLAKDEMGRPRKFGSRRHYCFSSHTYQEYSHQIVSAMAERYGKHPAVVAWQVDNEFGCHDTVRSYSEAAKQGFQNWCRNKYQSVEELNKSWGNVFWSMDYPDFDCIDLPNLTTTEANPSHQLDFFRFSSDQVVKYSNMQVELIRKHAPERDVLHNYMGNFTQYDQFKLGKTLDVATWDSYPLGFLLEGDASQELKDKYFRTGHPDNTALNHDMYRAVGKGRMWVMEQQPGPVNWAPHNASPLDGMVKLWSWEAFAHGAEVVSFFRWRQAPFAQEQFHAALNLPNGKPSSVWPEVETLKSQMDLLKDYDISSKCDVAMVFDYESDWALRIVKHGESYNPHSWFFDMYKTIRQLGVNVEIVTKDCDLSSYKSVVIPNLIHGSPELMERLDQFDGKVLVGPRSGSKTSSLTIPEQLAPGNFQALIPLSVQKVESMPLSIQVPCSIKGKTYNCSRWREWIDTDLTAKYSSDDGVGIFYEHKNISYLSACLNDDGLKVILKDFLEDSGLNTNDQKHGLRLKETKDLVFAFNYGPEKTKIESQVDFLVGAQELNPGDVSIWKRN